MPPPHGKASVPHSMPLGGTMVISRLLICRTGGRGANRLNFVIIDSMPHTAIHIRDENFSNE